MKLGLVDRILGDIANRVSGILDGFAGLVGQVGGGVERVLGGGLGVAEILDRFVGRRFGVEVGRVVGFGVAAASSENERGHGDEGESNLLHGNSFNQLRGEPIIFRQPAVWTKVHPPALGEGRL